MTLKFKMILVTKLYKWPSILNFKSLYENSIGAGRNWDRWWPPGHQVDRKMPWSSKTSRFWGWFQVLYSESIAIGMTTLYQNDFFILILIFSILIPCGKRSYGRKILHWTRLSLGTCLWTKLTSRWLVSV